MKVVQKKEFKIPDHLMMHDWAFTDSYYVLFANRIKLDFVGNVSSSSIHLPEWTTMTSHHSLFFFNTIFTTEK